MTNSIRTCMPGYMSSTRNEQGGLGTKSLTTCSQSGREWSIRLIRKVRKFKICHRKWTYTYCRGQRELQTCDAYVHVTNISWIFVEWNVSKESISVLSTKYSPRICVEYYFIHTIFVVNFSSIWPFFMWHVSFHKYSRWIFDEWNVHSSNIHRTYWVNICGMRRVTKKKRLLTKN